MMCQNVGHNAIALRDPLNEILLCHNVEIQLNFSL